MGSIIHFIEVKKNNRNYFEIPFLMVLGSVFKRFCDNFERESSLKSTTGRLRKLIRIIQYGSTCDRRFERL